MRLAKGQPTTDLYKAALEKPALAAAIRLKSDGLDDRLSQNSVTMKEPGRAVGVATDQMDAASAIFGNKPVQPRGPDFPKNLPETPKADDMSKQTWNLKWVPARTGIVEKNATITPDPEAKWEEMDNTLKRILARDYQGGNAFTPSAGIHAASVRDQLQSQSKIIDLRDGQRFGLPGTQGVTTG